MPPTSTALLFQHAATVIQIVLDVPREEEWKWAFCKGAPEECTRSVVESEPHAECPFATSHLALIDSVGVGTSPEPEVGQPIVLATCLPHLHHVRQRRGNLRGKIVAPH